MNREGLLKLREEIVASARQLALDSDVSPADKLEILMDIMRSGDMSQEVVSRAYESAKQLAEDDEKLGAFLDIIYQIDAKIADEEPSSDREEVSDTSETS